MPEPLGFVPAMGRDALLPLYDPFTWLLGAPAAHRRLLDEARIEPGHRVLEIGCGTGNVLLRAARTHPLATLVGLDPDPAALTRARHKATRKGLDIQLDRGFAGELPYPDGSIDRVLSAYMFHHLPAAEQARALSEVRRVLRPGGSLHLLDFGVGSEGLFHRVVRRHRPGSSGHVHATRG
jgi:ubiquinone/menaquinone biosynthesis C-methylase UbiE